MDITNWDYIEGHPRVSQLSNLKRKNVGRTAKDYTIVVAYDGTRTEDDYFRNWEQILSPERLKLLPQFVRSGGNVLKAVKECRKIARKLNGFAEFWCVCDVDDTNEDSLISARNLADESGIRLCLSNRCFEVWIRLHFEVSTAPILNSKDAIECIACHLKYYGNPQKVANFFDLFPKTSYAIRNGEQLEAYNLENPSTKVHNLVKKLSQNYK